MVLKEESARVWVQKMLDWIRSTCSIQLPTHTAHVPWVPGRPFPQLGLPAGDLMGSKTIALTVDGRSSVVEAASRVLRSQFVHYREPCRPGARRCPCHQQYRHLEINRGETELRDVLPLQRTPRGCYNDAAPAGLSAVEAIKNGALRDHLGGHPPEYRAAGRVVQALGGKLN